MDHTFKPHGEDELRAWLTGEAFQIAPKSDQWRDECNWYAYRRSTLPARRCEENEDKKGMQIVVTPSSIHASTYRYVEIDLCGEASGVWWKLRAYAVKPEDVATKLDAIEASLIAAWNALR